MMRNHRWRTLLALSLLLFFGTFVFAESSAWARSGGNGSAGSRGGRSFSAPSMPRSPSMGSQGLNSPGRATPGMPSQNQGGLFNRGSFMSGLAGGLLGSMLFGGTGHAATGGTPRGGIGLLDIALLALLLYLAWRFFKRRRSAAMAYQENRYDAYGAPEPMDYGSANRVQSGYQGSLIPGVQEDDLKEIFQDLFFRIQAAWMNRSLDGIRDVVAPEMTEYFLREFDQMKAQGRINRLENIAVRKVEVSEMWQESGMDYVTALITANLLDYTVDEATGRVIGGDRLNPVKFQEFWTFSRFAGTSRWMLSGINQVDRN